MIDDELDEFYESAWDHGYRAALEEVAGALRSCHPLLDAEEGRRDAPLHDCPVCRCPGGCRWLYANRHASEFNDCADDHRPSSGAA